MSADKRVCKCAEEKLVVNETKRLPEVDWKETPSQLKLVSFFAAVSVENS